MEAGQWVLTGVVALLVAAIIPYLILKYACRKPMPNVWMYLFCIFMFWMWMFAIYETPRKRRERLRKAGLKRGRLLWTLAVVPAASRFSPRG